MGGHLVRVEPAGVEIEVRPGEALIDAAWRLGYGWPTTCWGQADCTLCWVRVLSGADGVAPAPDDEQVALRTRLPSTVRGPSVRLACRLEIVAPGVVVEKHGVVPPSN